ncbi:ribonuclease III [Aerococcaceae bacterium NML191292]|nr:ribonuclease III [Aerococcaceae bacterium NML210727]MCW6655314.1 ribonuclease III [Aerococcaceae bacterium NML201296]MCW6660302.1 ribonuclease III [Aerococcaceae bacterium NML191292]MCW6662216.1 ribonuclease III [Aerococcaceae bacterium NML201209]MCW6663797.1 ribonuclease III [Aerococcaceae bacterium NML190073]MCW6667600.1 ribonuclease III [Aerococcaceae bacterium NML190938]MCW6675676.1 ribonuclease III [Aerococcaceae bacterium NML171108]MCW6676713.1 ribonuclease III [Aerococcaceae bacter
MKTIIQHLDQKLAIQFKNPELVQSAFRHTSYVNEQLNQLLESNERLEFLGDAVLEVLTSEFLYQQYPRYSEGQLTRTRAQLVCEASLSYLARQLGFDIYLQLGKGEERNGGRERDSILADCFEAFLGALYLDSGMESVRIFLKREMFNQHDVLIRQISQDYKTLFQERVQQKGKVLIQYRLLEQIGPAHALIFKVGLYVEGELIATGTGKNKKQAEMQAAQTAYQLTNQKGDIQRVSSKN